MEEEPALTLSTNLFRQVPCAWGTLKKVNPPVEVRSVGKRRENNSVWFFMFLGSP